MIDSGQKTIRNEQEKGETQETGNHPAFLWGRWRICPDLVLAVPKGCLIKVAVFGANCSIVLSTVSLPLATSWTKRRHRNARRFGRGAGADCDCFIDVSSNDRTSSEMRRLAARRQRAR
jgi:hypothetical protein